MVNFGDLLHSEQVRAWAAHYIHYQVLKKKLGELVALRDSAAGRQQRVMVERRESDFHNSLQHELHAVNAFAMGKFSELTGNAVELVRRIAAAEPAECALMGPDTDEVADLLIAVDSFIRMNVVGFEKITKKYDKVMHRSARITFMSQVYSAEFAVLQPATLLVALSACYTAIREARESLGLDAETGVEAGAAGGEVATKAESAPASGSGGGAGAEKGVEAGAAGGEVATKAESAPTSGSGGGAGEEKGEHADPRAAAEAKAGGGGDAKKNKVWKPPDSFERETTKYWVKYSDLMYVKCQVIKHLPLLLFGEDADKMMQAVSSDPTGLVETLDHMTKVADTQTINSAYLDTHELTHYHERIRREEGAQLVRVRWYGDRPSGSGQVFVERKVHHESWVKEASVKERFKLPWKKMGAFLEGNFDPAEAIDAGVAAGSISSSAAAKQKALAAKVRELVVGRRLRPKVRTMYRRTAFQFATSNRVRISIDTLLTLLNDDVERTDWVQNEESAGLLEDESVAMEVRVARRNLPEDPTWCYRFPFSILEVKLQGVAPAWVDDLLATGRLLQVYKFSKFLSGCAILHTPSIRALPHWFEEDGTIADDPHGQDLASFNEAATRERGSESAAESGPAAQGTRDDTVALWTDGPERPAAVAEANKGAPLHGIVARSALVDGGQGQEGSAPTSMRQRARRMLPDQCVSSGSPEGKLPGRYLPQKIEPKTFFANERTFIQWLGAAILLASLSMALITVSADNGGQTLSMGIVLFVISIGFLLYALGIFLWRARQIRAKKDGPYDDWFGPVLLVSILAVAMIANVVVTVNTGWIAGISMKHSASCVRFAGVDPIEAVEGVPTSVTWSQFYTPSCVIRVNASYYVFCSRANLVVMQLDQHGNPLQNGIDTIPTWPLDYEGGGLRSGGNNDLVWLVAEKPDNQVIEFSLSRRQRVVDVRLNTGDKDREEQLEGGAWMAAGATPGQTEVLWVSGDKNIRGLIPEMNLEGVVRDFDVHHILMSTMLEHTCTLCSTDALKIGELAAVGRELFILFDNSRVLLVINVDTTKVVAEHRIPGSSDARAWEGMAVDAAGLDADFCEEDPRTFTVVLAQNFPPEVWRFTYSHACGFKSC